MGNVVDRVKVYSSFQEKLMPVFYFSGIAFKDKDVFIGNTKNKNFVKKSADLVEGRFFSVITDGNKLTFKTDETGQELVFYYNKGKNWAVSNSFKKLCEHLHDNDVDLTINYASLVSFQGDHSFCESLVGNKTVINEINLLSASSYIEVINNVDFEVKDRPLFHEENDVQNLIKLSRKYIANWTSRLKVLVDYLPAGSIMCDLTGGMDSRLILSLLLASKSDLEKVDFVSNPLAPSDLGIAQLLASSYNLKLNKYAKSNRKTLGAREQLELTLYSSLGVYHGFYLPLNVSNKFSIHLHGGGGGLFRQVYNSNFEQILLNQARFFPKKTFLARSIEQLMKFDREKIDHYDYPATERSIRYFYETRNRYHFGRNWFKSIERSLVTPLISNAILDMRMLSKDLLEDKELYLLLFLLTTPELLQYPFDRADKNFSPSSIEKVRKIITDQSLDFDDSLSKEGFVFTRFDETNEVSDIEVSVREKPAVRILYEHVKSVYKNIDKKHLSLPFKDATEYYLKEKNLTKKACRSYLYLYLLDFLDKVTIKKKEVFFHHESVLAKDWDKSIYKNSPTIVNSLNIRGLSNIVGDNGEIIAEYSKRKYIIKQNLIVNGRYKQPLFLDKVLTKDKLQGVVNIAEGEVFGVTEVSEAWAFLKGLKTKAGVVKPISGVGGYGITTNIKTYDELYRAINVIQDEKFLLEEFYQGDDCRIYVVGGKAIAAAVRKSPEIVGNGVSTVKELIDAKKIERSQKAYFQKHDINVNESIYLHYPLNKVLPEGEIVKLNDTGNISRGGESYDVTDKMHHSFQEIAASCWIAYGCQSDHFAIDIICEDISREVSLQSYAILELNAKPGHGQHVYPYSGTSKRLTDEIVNYWFPVN